MTVIDTLNVDLSIVLGKSRMPLRSFLGMGRGDTVKLEASDADLVEVLANGHPIARGHVAVRGQSISVEITQIFRKAEVTRIPGETIGGSIKAVVAPDLTASDLPLEAA